MPPLCILRRSITLTGWSFPSLHRHSTRVPTSSGSIPIFLFFDGSDSVIAWLVARGGGWFGDASPPFVAGGLWFDEAVPPLVSVFADGPPILRSGRRFPGGWVGLFWENSRLRKMDNRKPIRYFSRYLGLMGCNNKIIRFNMFVDIVYFHLQWWCMLPKENKSSERWIGFFWISLILLRCVLTKTYEFEETQSQTKYRSKVNKEDTFAPYLSISLYEGKQNFWPNKCGAKLWFQLKLFVVNLFFLFLGR